MRPIRRTPVAGSTAFTLTAACVVAGIGAGVGTAQASTCSQSGVYYSAVTQSNINSTICVSGWTATVRPPTSYTNPLKAQGIIDYGYSDTNMSDYEEDHMIPLELGGSPRDPRNLWPEPHYGTKTAYTKDGVETKFKNAVCAGTITLSAARSAIKNNWTTALQVTGIG